MISNNNFLLGLPSTPELKLIHHGRDYLTVSWTPPADGGSALNRYTLHFSNNSFNGWSSSDISHSGSSLRFVLLLLLLLFCLIIIGRFKYDGLQVNKNYSVRIHSVNMVGPSPISIPLNISTDSGNHY